MKAEIAAESIQRFGFWAKGFTFFFILTIVAAAPLFYFFDLYGLAIELLLAAIALAFAIKVEALKKNHRIHTYKEIAAFLEGMSLDEMAQMREKAKAPYQKCLLSLAFSALTIVVFILLYKGLLWLN